MHQQWDQGRNLKIPWNKWKWGDNNPKSVGHWESNPKREIHGIAGLSPKKLKRKDRKRKSSNKQSDFTYKGAWKTTTTTTTTTNKAQSEQKEGNN